MSRLIKLDPPAHLSRAPRGTGWQPILEGELAERARQTLRAIGGTLRIPWPEAAPPLAHGLAGQALLQAYLSRADIEGGSFEAARFLLDRAIEGIEHQILPPSLFSGFVGVAWVAEVLLEGEPPGEEDPNEEIDEALGGLVERTPWRGEYDLIGGLVGFGVYALKRLPRTSAVHCLERIAARLRELAIRREPGFTWVTPPRLLVSEGRKLHPRGWCNLGVAHGIPGILGLLSRMHGARIALDDVEPLLDGSVGWLLAQRLPEGGESAFPYYVDEEKAGERYPGRSAWCYGDPGIAVCLLHAARTRGNEEWEQTARAVARSAARQPYESTGVVDAGLCHGAAGLGHIYNRLYQATQDEVFFGAAKAWLSCALEMQVPGVGVAGYRSWSNDREGEWIDDPGYLTGAAGVGLALAAAVSHTEPTWDGALLLDLKR